MTSVLTQTNLFDRSSSVRTSPRPASTRSPADTRRSTVGLSPASRPTASRFGGLSREQLGLANDDDDDRDAEARPVVTPSKPARTVPRTPVSTTTTRQLRLAKEAAATRDVRSPASTARTHSDDDNDNEDDDEMQRGIVTAPIPSSRPAPAVLRTPTSTTARSVTRPTPTRPSSTAASTARTLALPERTTPQPLRPSPRPTASTTPSSAAPRTLLPTSTRTSTATTTRSLSTNQPTAPSQPTRQSTTQSTASQSTTSQPTASQSTASQSTASQPTRQQVTSQQAAVTSNRAPAASLTSTFASTLAADSSKTAPPASVSLYLQDERAAAIPAPPQSVFDSRSEVVDLLGLELDELDELKARVPAQQGSRSLGLLGARSAAVDRRLNFDGTRSLFSDVNFQPLPVDDLLLPITEAHFIWDVPLKVPAAAEVDFPFELCSSG